MRWDDVRTVLGVSALPEVPTSRMWSGGTVPPLPDAPVAEWPVGLVELHARVLQGEPAHILATLDKLAEVADRPSMGRRLRRLDQPRRVVLEYAGKTKVGDATLTAEQNNQFAGQVTDQKEDI